MTTENSAPGTPRRAQTPDQTCSFRLPVRPAACVVMFPDDEQHWCGACLMHKYEPERFAAHVEAVKAKNAAWAAASSSSLLEKLKALEDTNTGAFNTVAFRLLQPHSHYVDEAAADLLKKVAQLLADTEPQL